MFSKLVSPFIWVWWWFLNLFSGTRGQVLRFTSRMYDLMENKGFGILRSLKIFVLETRSGALKRALVDVVDNLESGSTMSEAMGKHPRFFDRVYVSMVKAGEAGGALEVILQRLVAYLKKPAKGELGRSMRALSVTFGSGVPILEALMIAQEICRTPACVQMYKSMHDSIRQGDTLAYPMKKSGVVCDEVVALIDEGEGSGDLDIMLERAATLLESDGL